MNSKHEHLVMSKDYNDFSQPQGLGLLHGVNEIFQPILRSHIPFEWGNKIVLADFGCSAGRNSIVLVQRIFQMLKETSGKEITLQAVLSDLPQNNYNAVFQSYQESQIANEKNIFVSCAVGSFTSRFCPVIL
jgi:hypothetical protein